MNWSFMLAGTTSTNPVLFMLMGLLILGWKVAGYYGLDRYLLPMLGTPWTQHQAAELKTPRAPAATPPHRTCCGRTSAARRSRPR